MKGLIAVGKSLIGLVHSVLRTRLIRLQAEFDSLKKVIHIMMGTSQQNMLLEMCIFH